MLWCSIASQGALVCYGSYFPFHLCKAVLAIQRLIPPLTKVNSVQRSGLHYVQILLKRI